MPTFVNHFDCAAFHAKSFDPAIMFRQPDNALGMLAAAMAMISDEKKSKPKKKSSKRRKVISSEKVPPLRTSSSAVALQPAVASKPVFSKEATVDPSRTSAPSLRPVAPQSTPRTKVALPASLTPSQPAARIFIHEVFSIRRSWDALRAAVLAQLKSKSGASRGVIVHGASGTGKTALVEALGRESFVDMVWVRGQGTLTLAGALTELVQLARRPLPRGKYRIVVIDNLESRSQWKITDDQVKNIRTAKKELYDMKITDTIPLFICRSMDSWTWKLIHEKKWKRHEVHILSPGSLTQLLRVRFPTASFEHTNSAVHMSGGDIRVAERLLRFSARGMLDVLRASSKKPENIFSAGKSALSSAYPVPFSHLKDFWTSDPKMAPMVSSACLSGMQFRSDVGFEEYADLLDAVSDGSTSSRLVAHMIVRRSFAWKSDTRMEYPQEQLSVEMRGRQASSSLRSHYLEKCVSDGFGSWHSTSGASLEALLDVKAFSGAEETVGHEDEVRNLHRKPST